MAHKNFKEKAALKDHQNCPDVQSGNEFDDELTAPVLPGDDGANYLREDRGEDSVVVVRHSLTAGPTEDQPLQSDPARTDRFEDEYTAPVYAGPDAGDHVDDGPSGGSVAAHEHSPSDPRQEDRLLQPGYLLRDRFEIVELVHTGNMSRVYKAVDRQRHPTGSAPGYVAIKMLRPSTLPARYLPAMLEREAAGAQRLSHPNIVNTLDFDMHDEHVYLVMEWLEGESVKELLERTAGQNLATEFAWQIIHGVARALEHAHLNEIVHADINLSNIFITDTKQIKLLDFGVSRCGVDDEMAAGDELIWVTHKYASPEVLSGSVPVITDDIFALGCVAYRLLSGRHPFAGTPSLEAKESGLTVQPVPGLSERHWQILRQALAFERADRPTTVSVFLDKQPAPSEHVKRPIWEARTAWLVALPVAAILFTAGLWSLLKTGPTEEALPVTRPAVVAGPALGEKTPGADDIDEPRRTARIDAQLETAGQAAAEEDLSQTDAGMFEAERDPRADARAPDGVPPLTAENNEEQQLVEALAIAEEYMAARRLTLPAGDNAYALLLDLREQHGADDRLRAATDHLGNMLLDEAVIASTAREDADAMRLLTAAENLGMDPAAIERTRRVLATNSESRVDTQPAAAAAPSASPDRQPATTVSAAETTPAPATDEAQQPADTQTTEPTVPAQSTEQEMTLAAAETTPAPATEEAQQPADTQTAEPTVPVQSTEQETTLAAAAVGTAEVPHADPGASGTPAPQDKPATDVATQPKFVSLADLEIEKYVAPIYPRGARHRGLTGSVEMHFRILADGSTGDIEVISSQPGEVFVASAKKAVSKWRFAPPGEVVSAKVTVRFDED